MSHHRENRAKRHDNSDDTQSQDIIQKRSSRIGKDRSLGHNDDYTKDYEAYGSSGFWIVTRLGVTRAAFGPR